MSSAEPPGGGDNAAPGSEDNAPSFRCFCPWCYNTILAHASAGRVYVCPICDGELPEESARPSSSSASSSRLLNPEALPFFPYSGPLVSRRATFEQRDLRSNDVHVVSESGFFSSPYANSVPISTPLPSNGSVITLEFLRRYIEYCVNEGARINSNLLRQQMERIFQHFVNLNRPKSAPQSAIASLPDLKITEDFVASDEAECPVCTEDFKIGEEAKRLPCMHLYHKDCILTWLKQSNSCPVCRFKLTASDPNFERLSAAWNPQPLASSAAGEETAGSREQNTAEQRPNPNTMRFQIELVWPSEYILPRFQNRSSTDVQGSGENEEENEEDSNDNEASGLGEQESDHEASGSGEQESDHD